MTQQQNPTNLVRPIAQSRRPDQCDAAQNRRRRRNWIAMVAMGAIVTITSGCTMFNGLQSKIRDTDCLDDFMISHRNKVMATKAWLRIQHCYRKHPCMKDLRAGFIDGYLEVATGGSGCTPTVVSSNYWGWRHQCAQGQCSINAWFEGFPLGVKAAEQDGIGHYNQIRLNQVPYARPAAPMTGSLAPTPAVVQPAAPVTSSPMHSQLPPGVELGEGETLVPGAIEFKDVDSGGPEVVTPPVGAPIAPPTPRPGLKTAPVAPPAPVESASETLFDFGGRPNSPSDMAVADLVPKAGSKTNARPAVSLPPAVADTSLTSLDNGLTAEPTQEEIDSVIEEIFGKPSGKPAPVARPSGGSLLMPPR